MLPYNIPKTLKLIDGYMTNNGFLQINQKTTSLKGAQHGKESL
jgi:hypothetical protein